MYNQKIKEMKCCQVSLFPNHPFLGALSYLGSLTDASNKMKIMSRLWALISKCVWGRKDFKWNIFFSFHPRRMWKVLSASLELKMLHLSGVVTHHMQGPLGWLGICFMPPGPPDTVVGAVNIEASSGGGGLRLWDSQVDFFSLSWSPIFGPPEKHQSQENDTWLNVA